MTQLVFDLSRAAAYRRSDFFASASNAGALGWVERWPAWQVPAVVVHGPTGAGKTHLAHIWRDRCGGEIYAGAELAAGEAGAMLRRRRPAVAVDDADRAAEDALLHLFNAVVEASGSLLLTARHPPGIWQPALADLASRLRSVPAIGVTMPDDALLAAVLAKHFADRQLQVAPLVIDYLVRRIERSFAAAGAVAAALDGAALREGSAVSKRLAARILAAAAGQPLSSGSFDGVR